MLGKTTQTPAVFFDRDGTLMEDVDYCRDPAQVVVFADAVHVLVQLREAGFRLVLVTNQSGIGRGYFSEGDYRAVHGEFLRQIGRPLLSGCYFCADAPEEASERRKPAPGMVLEAARDLGLDLGKSFVVGDKGADVELARRAGLAGGVLVLTGKGREERARCEPDFVAATLTEAADWILGRSSLKHG